MAAPDFTSQEPPPVQGVGSGARLLRNAFSFDGSEGTGVPGHAPENDVQPPRSSGIFGRGPKREVVPGLPRQQTFKRQQSELRDNLLPTTESTAERRTVSVDRRIREASRNGSHVRPFPRASAPDLFLNGEYDLSASLESIPHSPIENLSMDGIQHIRSPVSDEPQDYESSLADDQSMTSSQYESNLRHELESIWILNLSMHFRDRSKREKFFVTYRQLGPHGEIWRRVTVSLDYRDAPEGSLEWELVRTRFQREKSAKIYDAIRESLSDIQFYDTVTNLKLQTTDGRLHVHVVEDVNEIIQYPPTRMINHLRCRRVKERDIEFDSHMSGFVYKVVVDGQILIKKEIPGPDTVEEFLYEINALCRLRDSENVIQFYGVIVDDHDAHVKGLLISYAEKGALIDVIYDHNHTLPWATREKWARQIVDGLSDIHEAGFVQGDFTLSNIVIDADDNAKIIDINRRGCPVGWEPPEATPLIECNQRITMYIGVKSDLFQLGMVLWALATQEDEPETQGRPLTLDDEPDIPPWYRRMVDICLSENPCLRLQASALRSFFPDPVDDYTYHRHMAPAISVDGTYADFGRRYDMYDGKNTAPQIRTVEPRSDWPISSMGHKYVDPATAGFHEPYYYPTRGRSPPRSRTPSSYSRHLSYPANAVPVSDTSDATSAVDIDAADLERSKSATPRTMHDSQIVLEKPREQSVAAPEEADDKAPAPASLLLSDEQKIDRIQQVATDDGPHYRAPTPPPPPPDVSVGQDVADATLGQQSGGDNEVDLAAVPTTPCDDAPAKDLGSTEPDKITSEHDVLESTPIERSGVTEALDEERIVGPTDDPIPPSIPQPQNNGQGDDTTVTTTIEATNQAALSPPALLPAELTGVGDQYYEMSLEQKMLEASLADDPIFTIGGESEGLTATAGLT